MIVEIQNVTKIIKNNTVLDNVCMKMESGNVYGLQGKNGSGKTMLMRSICGLMRISNGEIKIDGKVLGRDMSFPDSVGVLIENPAFLPNYTAYDNLKLIAAIKRIADERKIKETLEAVGLDPEDKRKYRKFSLGMKQRLGIACAVMENPDIVLLDEPFNALDDMGIELVRKLIEQLRDQGKIIVLACHDKEELLNLSDRVFMMKAGKLCEE